MLDQMQVSESSYHVEPLNFPHPLQFGHVLLTNNFQDFLEAIEYGIDAHQQADSDTTAMSTRELLAFFKHDLDTKDPLVPRYWRIGFLIGDVIGLLFPTLDKNNLSQTYLESLSQQFREPTR